jgi:hypothetical protein
VSVIVLRPAPISFTILSLCRHAREFHRLDGPARGAIHLPEFRKIGYDRLPRGFGGSAQGSRRIRLSETG